MSDANPGGSQPPLPSSKTGGFPVKRAGLKRTLSAGASPKKQQIVSKAAANGAVHHSSTQETPSDATKDQNVTASSTTPKVNYGLPRSSPPVPSQKESPIDELSSDGTNTSSTASDSSSQSSHMPARRPPPRPPSASVASRASIYGAVVFNKSNTPDGTSNNTNGALPASRSSPKAPLANRPFPTPPSSSTTPTTNTTPPSSNEPPVVIDLASASSNKSTPNSAPSPPIAGDSAESLVQSEKVSSINSSPSESTTLARISKPTAPPKPASASLRHSVSRVTSLNSPTTNFKAFEANDPTSSTTSEIPTSAQPITTLPKTGAQMRPPVPKKSFNLTSSPVSRPPSSTPPTFGPPAHGRTSSSPPPISGTPTTPYNGTSAHDDSNQSPIIPPSRTPSPSRPPLSSNDSVNSSTSQPSLSAHDEGDESDEHRDEHRDDSAPRSFHPTLTRTKTPRSLNFNHTKLSSASGITASPSDSTLHSNSFLPTPGSSPGDTGDPAARTVDDKGRVVTIGKPRSADYYQLDLAALDLEDKKKKQASSGSSFRIGSLAKNIVNLRPRRSPSDTSVDSNDDEEVDTVSWPTAKRVKLEWPEFIAANQPSYAAQMVDQSVLASGFHIEYGDPQVTSLPTNLSLDHCGEYVPYYAEVLYPIEHSNYVAFEDEADLYWIVSIEDKPKSKRQSNLRSLIRTRKDYIRANIDVATLSTSFTDSFSRGSSVKVAALSKIMPEIEKLKFVRVKAPELNDELKSMEEKEVKLGTAYKFGVLYVKPGQTEDEIFANTDPSPGFNEFLDMMGTKIELFGWDKYRGGLDVKNRSTGEYSVYHEIHGVSVMFHVCTLLPSQENDLQRVERKRHIGNDVVTFIYLEEGCEPYLATKLTSQFIHIHYLVQKIPGTGAGTSVPASYRIAVVTKYGVEPHYPSVPFPAVFEKSPQLRDFLITKAINSERTAMLATEFRSKMLRARKDFLKHLYETFSKSKKTRGSSPANH